MPATISTDACPASSIAETKLIRSVALETLPRSGVQQHRLQLPRRKTGERLQGLGLLTRRSPAPPWRPCAVRGPAILGLEYGQPIIPCAGSSHWPPSAWSAGAPRPAARVATFVRRAVSTEMYLEKLVRPGRYSRWNCAPASSNSPTASTLLIRCPWRRHLGDAGGKQEWRGIERHGLADTATCAVLPDIPGTELTTECCATLRRASHSNANAAMATNNTIRDDGRTTRCGGCRCARITRRRTLAAAERRQSSCCRRVSHDLLAPLLVTGIDLRSSKMAARSDADSAPSIAENAAAPGPPLTVAAAV